MADIYEYHLILWPSQIDIVKDVDEEDGVIEYGSNRELLVSCHSRSAPFTLPPCSLLFTLQDAGVAGRTHVTFCHFLCSI